MSELFSQTTFCVRPWTHLQLKNNGKLRFCCDAQPGNIVSSDGRHLSAENVSIEDIRNSPNMNRVRAQMLAGEKPVECKKCWETELNGGKSLRQKENAAWSQSPTDKVNVRSIELRLGNSCNLRCRMCGPGNSNKWYEDYLSLTGSSSFREDETEYDFLKDADLFTWHENPETINRLFSLSPELSEIQFVGGEPFMSKSHLPLLKKLIASKEASKISLRYTTNLTLLSDDFFQLWSHFKEVTISVSIDGMGSVFEYIRTPAVWEQVVHNLHRIDREIGRSVARVSIQPTPNIYNIFQLVELSQWTLQTLRKVGWTAHLNFQEGPSWQSAYILTPSYKIEVMESFNQYGKKLSLEEAHDPRISRIISWFESLSSRLALKNWTYLQKEFKIKNERLDQIRQQSLLSAIPEVYNAIFTEF